MASAPALTLLLGAVVVVAAARHHGRGDASGSTPVRFGAAFTSADSAGAGPANR